MPTVFPQDYLSDVLNLKAYDTYESFLLKATFERKLSDMTYPVAQVFTFKL